MKHARITAVLLGLGILAQNAALAQTTYTIRPILKAGDPAGDLTIPRTYSLWLGGFSDRSHLVLAAFPPDLARGEILLQYADGKFTTIAAPGREGLAGTWPEKYITVWWNSNHRGTTLFSVMGDAWLGHYRRDPDSGSLTPVLTPGMPVGEYGTIAEFGPPARPCVNNHDELAAVIEYRDGAGKLRNGIFFTGRDGQWQPVLLPEQELPGGGKVLDEGYHALRCSDAGVVAFLARRPGETQHSAFLWEAGQIRSVLRVGTDAPGGGKITAVSDIQINNSNQEVVVAAAVDNRPNHGLYRVVDGAPIPVAVPGQAMPGGGTFRTIRYTEIFNSVWASDGIGRPNLKGQLAFLATLADGSSALYVMDPDGKVSLVFRQGQQTPQGRITSVEGFWPTVNSSGEIAILLSLNSGPQTVAILSPVSPSAGQP